MDSILKITNLSKEYPQFRLSDVCFEVKAGSIMGFIGRNGAGKTTTLKCILNLAHKSGGVIEFFGKDLSDCEEEIKKQIGFASGAVNYYVRKPIRKIAEITKSFYEEWDDGIYKKYIDLFKLDESKSPLQLSEGMKVKLNLTLALSHNAKIIILDEPTSGLDPVSRSELLDVFCYLKKQGIAVLFSTHIISDLEKCADSITYIKDGKIVYTGDIAEFIKSNDGKSLEEIMLSYEKEGFYEKLGL